MDIPTWPWFGDHFAGGTFKPSEETADDTPLVSCRSKICARGQVRSFAFSSDKIIPLSKSYERSLSNIIIKGGIMRYSYLNFLGAGGVWCFIRLFLMALLQLILQPPDLLSYRISENTIANACTKIHWLKRTELFHVDVLLSIDLPQRLLIMVRQVRVRSLQKKKYYLENIFLTKLFVDWSGYLLSCDHLALFINT